MRPPTMIAGTGSSSVTFGIYPDLERDSLDRLWEDGKSRVSPFFNLALRLRSPTVWIETVTARPDPIGQTSVTLTHRITLARWSLQAPRILAVPRFPRGCETQTRDSA